MRTTPNTILVLETRSGARVHVPLAEGAAPGDQLTFTLPEEATAALSAGDIDDLSMGRIVVTADVEEEEPGIEL